MVYYKKTESGKFKRMRTVKNHVGQTISTKKPDGMPMPKNTLSNWTLIDVTKHYKWPEGSLDERTSVARARRYAGSEILEEKEEVNITIKTAREEFDIGQDVTVFVTVKNTSADTENRMKISSVRLMMSSLDYTGQKNKQIRKIDNQGFYINPGEEKQFDMTVTWDQYNDKLQDMGNLQASVVVNVAKSGNSFPENLIFTLRNPAIIDIEVPDNCKVGTNVSVKFTVVNPLQIPLTKCILKIDDEKFEDHQDVDQIDIAPKSKWTTTLEMKPIRPGRGLVIAALDTKELPDITGFSETDISE
ncbi:protein-glutamine gamma-glutamyltransferase K-like [Mizuhopecten yessoensis]|uniref:protein-glutamine gamma-glutamyltransferase K-like n=1 Tax=Mizuhopecten yessoensis TaxID=6573 RepID=UPI000B45B511|nr:protein-glutamine gamma-glutamyltransferase K-like [Mizuhopecten yessoensis]